MKIKSKFSGARLRILAILVFQAIIEASLKFTLQFCLINQASFTANHRVKAIISKSGVDQLQFLQAIEEVWVDSEDLVVV
jgi:hypothetical protein